MELGDFNDNSSSLWAPEWKSKTNLLQRPDVFNFQGCGFESLSVFRLWKCQDQTETALGFLRRGDKEAPRTFSMLSSREPPCKKRRADLRAPPRALQARRSGCSLHAALKSLYLRGPISEPWHALKHIHSSGKYGPPTWGRRAIQLRAKLRQSKCQPRLEAKESFQWEVWGFPQAMEEQNTNTNRQEFGCIFLSFFCNKISSVILALRDSNLLYAAAKV